VVTAAPELANLRNAKNLLDLLKQSRHPDGPPHLVLNMVGMPKRPEIAVKEVCQNPGLTPAATIECDAADLGQAANNGHMVEELNKKARAVQPFRELAMSLAHRKELAQAPKSALGPLLQKLKIKL